jgi:hypothetical protein
MNFILVLLTAFTANAATAEFPIARLQGVFAYQKNFDVPQIRRAETVSLQSPTGEKRAQQLRSEGYGCIHQNMQTLLCSKTWIPGAPPPGMQVSVDKFMTPIRIGFSGGTNPPVLSHDGSTTQEWDVNEKVQVMATTVNMYRVVKTNKNEVYVVFPVSDSQPLTPLFYHGPKRLSISVLANNKDSPTSTISYTIRGYLEQRP